MNKSLNLLSDQELLNQCKLNDERAFNTLFDRYFKRLFNFGFGLIQDEEVAKEIAMDVMMRLWQKKGDLVIGDELLPYLFRSIKNAVYNHWRKSKIITHSLEVFEDSLQNSVPSADSNLEFKELEKQYADFLNEMPEQRRKIFHLSRNENLTYAEIADQLNLSVHTVRNQMSSSVRYFRKHMGDISKLIIIIYLKW